MKPSDSKKASKRLDDDVRQRVLDLRRSHSLSQVAALTGLPLGTVKTLCSRSGAFRDNPVHRAMFTLPPIKESLNRDVSVPELPPQQTVTGDREIDAVLWLHAVIRTGRPELIEKAMAAAKKIKTPLKDLEKRYGDFVVKANPGNWVAAFSSIGFADLEDIAERAVQKLARQQEARGRFGTDDELFAPTPAEQFCEEALAGVSMGKLGIFLDEKQVDSILVKRLAVLPHTLADCLHELNYWSHLYWLRSAMGGGDASAQAQAREDFAFRRMAFIRPSSPAEAVAVFRYIAEQERMDRSETTAILLNLMGAAGTKT